MQMYHLNHINNKLIIQFFTYFYVDIFVNQHNVLTNTRVNKYLKKQIDELLKYDCINK